MNSVYTHYIYMLLFFLFALTATSQTYPGYYTDNYSGIHSVLHNPANASDSRLEYDLNIVSANVNFLNDYVSGTFSEIIDGDFNFNTDGNVTVKNPNTIQFNNSILGPSLLYSLNPKSAIGITTRVRVSGNVNNIDGNLINLFDVGLSGDSPLIVENNNLNATLSVWNELGFTYSAVIADRKKHFVKVGATAKLVSGRAFITVASDDATVEFDPADQELEGRGTATYTFSKSLDRNINGKAYESFDDFDLKASTLNVGLDLGFVYEWRPNEKEYHAVDIDTNRVGMQHKNKYRAKFGLSITDIGSSTYDSAVSNFYDLDTSIDRSLVENGSLNGDIDDELDPEKNLVNKKIGLPTALHANLDYKIREKLYINLNADLSLIDEEQGDANHIINNYTITPRFESKWFGVHVPVNYQELNGLTIGSGIRLGPLFVGSGTVISNIISDKTGSANYYAGIKLPIYHKPSKDFDNDGVANEIDTCKMIAGLIENKGCPGPQPDDKSQLSKVKDSDGDGTVDYIDKCPYTPGSVATNGCPEDDVFIYSEEAAQEIEAALQIHSDAISFKYDKAYLLPETHAVLDKILEYMNKYPTTKYIVEGHTDPIGTEEYNFNLSLLRALNVKKYFTNKGIDQERLIIKGYGESRYEKGNKSKNRRAAVILIK
ncbi:DUF5723 family protein [Aquimarina agarivorans]|uniref:DUF5723 family protein n=1 Tax=Aquimarina agarivorans TaxID=980584 RepID=UPI000248E6D2|nr:DUF5723 family protein [Aquimarina agarivorans]